jgi:hypothetical protein
MGSGAAKAKTNGTMPDSVSSLPSVFAPPAEP